MIYTFGQTPLFCSRDNVWEPYIQNLTFQSTYVTLKIGQGHQNLVNFSISQQ